MSSLRPVRSRRDVFFHFVFWSWNAIFVALAVFGLAPEVLWPLAREAMAGSARRASMDTSVCDGTMVLSEDGDAWAAARHGWVGGHPSRRTSG